MLKFWIVGGSGTSKLGLIALIARVFRADLFGSGETNLVEMNLATYGSEVPEATEHWDFVIHLEDPGREISWRSSTTGPHPGVINRDSPTWGMQLMKCLAQDVIRRELDAFRNCHDEECDGMEHRRTFSRRIGHLYSVLGGFDDETIEALNEVQFNAQ